METNKTQTEFQHKESEKLYKFSDFNQEILSYTQLAPISKKQGHGYLSNKAKIRFLKERKHQSVTKFFTFSKNYFKVYELNGSKNSFKYLYSGYLDDPQRLIDWKENPYLYINPYNAEVKVVGTFKAQADEKANEGFVSQIMFFNANLNTIHQSKNVSKIKEIAKIQRFNPPYYIETLKDFTPKYLDNIFINSSTYFISKYTYGDVKFPGKKNFSYMADAIRRHPDAEGSCVKRVFELFGWNFDNQHLKKKLEADKLLVDDERIRNQLRFNSTDEDEFSMFSYIHHDSSYYYCATLNKEEFIVLSILDMRSKKVLKTSYITIYEIWATLGEEMIKNNNSLYNYGIKYCFRQDRIYLSYFLEKTGHWEDEDDDDWAVEDDAGGDAPENRDEAGNEDNVDQESENESNSLTNEDTNGREDMDENPGVGTKAVDEPSQSNSINNSKKEEEAEDEIPEVLENPKETTALTMDQENPIDPQGEVNNETNNHINQVKIEEPSVIQSLLIKSKTKPNKTYDPEANYQKYINQYLGENQNFDNDDQDQNKKTENEGVLFYSKLYNRYSALITISHIFDSTKRKVTSEPISENQLLKNYDANTLVNAQESKTEIQFTFINRDNNSKKTIRINKKENEISTRISLIQNISKIDCSKFFFCDSRMIYLIDMQDQVVLDRMVYSHLLTDDLNNVQTSRDLIMIIDKWNLIGEFFRVDGGSVRLVKQLDLIPIIDSIGKQAVRIRQRLALERLDNWTLFISFIVDVVVNSQKYLTEKLVVSFELSLTNWEVRRLGWIKLDRINPEWGAISMTVDQGSAFLVNKNSYEVVVAKLDENYLWNIRRRMIYDSDESMDEFFYKDYRFFVTFRRECRLDLIKFNPEDLRAVPVVLASVHCTYSLDMVGKVPDSSESSYIWLVEQNKRIKEKKDTGEDEDQEDTDLDEGGAEEQEIEPLNPYLRGYDHNLKRVFELELDQQSLKLNESSHSWDRLGDIPALIHSQSMTFFDFDKKVMKKVEFGVRRQSKLLTTAKDGGIILFESKKAITYEPVLPGSPAQLFKLEVD